MNRLKLKSTNQSSCYDVVLSHGYKMKELRPVYQLFFHDVLCENKINSSIFNAGRVFLKAGKAYIFDGWYNWDNLEHFYLKESIGVEIIDITELLNRAFNERYKRGKNE